MSSNPINCTCIYSYFFLNMLLKVLLVNDHATGTDDNNNYIQQQLVHYYEKHLQERVKAYLQGRVKNLLLVFAAKNTFFHGRAMQPPLKTRFQERATPSTAPGNAFVRKMRLFLGAAHCYSTHTPFVGTGNFLVRP